MRLPYLQVTQETWARARMMAALLEIDRHRGFTLLMDLWHWAVDLGPKEEPPNGTVDGPRAALLMAGAVEWSGDPEALTAAFIEVGVVERTETGLRVRGMDRYKRTWEKNKRRTSVPETGATSAGNRQKPARIVPVTGEKPAEPAPEPARQTQTQTQTHIETLSGARSPAEGAPFALAHPEPKGRSRKLGPGERLYSLLERDREAASVEAGEPFTPEHWSVARQNTSLGAIAKRARERPDDGELFQAAWHRYLDDPESPKKTPPFSLQYFLSSLSKWESLAKQGRPQA